MKRMRKLIFSVVLTLALVVSAAVPVFAADAAVFYDGDAQEFIFAPGSDYSPTDLFDNFKGVMPGDSLTQKITIQNDVSKKVNVKVYLRSIGAKEDSEAFLSHLNLTVTHNDDPLFSAPANETASLTDWVCLGTYASGAKTDLTLTLDVPITLDTSFEDAVGVLGWEFKVEEIPVEGQPDTNDDLGILSYLWIGFAAAAVILTGVLLFLYRKRKQEDELPKEQ